MRRSPWLPLALLLAASPGLAQDLTGYYRVEGDLPGPGGAFTAVATMSPSTGSTYRVRVLGRTAEGRGVRLSGLGRLTAGRLEVRYRALGGGLTGVLEGGEPLRDLVGRYRVVAGGDQVGGRLTAAGASAGRASYARAALPTLRFSPGALELAPGDALRAELRGDAEALGVVSIRGPGSTRLSGTGATRTLTVTGLPPGEHTFTAHVGTTRGPVVARLRVRVAAPTRITDAVADEVGQVAAAGGTPVVIFDLDDTLFETLTRSATIIREFGEQVGDARLRAARNEHVRFGLEDTLAQVGLTPAEIEGDLGRRVRRFWSPRFFNGTHYHLDTPLPGAATYVQRLHGLGARVVYLTGRKDVGREPSLAALRGAGFPVDERTAFFCKPDPAPGEPKLETAAWKGQTARTEVAAMGTVVAAFDNEPVNVNALREALPATTRVVFLDTLYKPDSPPLLAEVVTIRDYE